MKSNPENWQKCTMFVQDLVEPGLNITARVSKEDAHNFQALCQMFSISCRSKLTNETKPNTSQTMPQRKSVSLNNLHGIKLSVNRDKSSKSGQLMASTQSAAKKKKPTQNPIFIIDEAIKNKEIFEIIHCELSKVSSRSDARMRSESKILGLLKHHFKMFDRSLAIVPFGSTTYGFGGGQSNYNIFVDTRKTEYFCNSVCIYFNVVRISFRQIATSSSVGSIRKVRGKIGRQIPLRQSGGNTKHSPLKATAPLDTYWIWHSCTTAGWWYSHCRDIETHSRFYCDQTNL